MPFPSLTCTIGLLVIIACGQKGEPMLANEQPESSVPFTIDLWPGEGIPVIQMRRVALPLHAEPDPAAPIVDTLHGRIDQRLTFDSTRYQTVQPGAFRFTTNTIVTGRDFGSVRHVTRDLYYRGRRPDVSIPVTSSSTVDYLQYRAEGTCFVRVGERVIDADPCPGAGRDSVDIIRQPVTRWWIFVRGDAGTQGWLIVSDTTAVSVRREF